MLTTPYCSHGDLAEVCPVDDADLTGVVQLCVQLLRQI